MLVLSHSLIISASRWIIQRLLYIKIIRGINEEEIVKNTFKYRDYLNTMYQYQKLITELENS